MNLYQVHMTDIQNTKRWDKYIGNLEPYSKEFADGINLAIETWSNNIRRVGLFRQWQQNYAYYHNADPNGLTFAEDAFRIVGENGELVRAAFNEFRNLLTHILNMTVSQPPALMAKAVNSEPASLIAAQTYDGVLDYYLKTWKEGRIRKLMRRCVELAGIMSNGHLLIEWDASVGKEIVPDESGVILREGDLYVKSKSVLDVIFDTNAEDEEERNWVIIRDYENRFELIAKYPDQREQIEKVPSKTEAESSNRAWGWDENTDLVPVYKYYHKETRAVPEGRYALILDRDTILYDGPNPYGQIPLFTVRANDGLGTLYGYSSGNDLAPVQAAFNMIVSAVTTNFAAFGVQNIAMKKGDEIQASVLAGKLNVFEYLDTPPQAVNLTAQPPQALDYTEFLKRSGETYSGANSVIRGDPDSQLKSGKALGIVQAMAVQYNSYLQMNYAQLLEDVGNFLLKLLRKFATTERVTSIVGKNKMLKSSNWTGATFDKVDRVVVEIVDPAMRTIGYKTDLAEFMVSNGLIKTPQDMITVITTGQLDPMLDDAVTEQNLVREENDSLLRGEEVPLLYTDNDEYHIAKHSALLANPAIRKNGVIVPLVLKHIFEHQKQLASKLSSPPMPAQASGPQGGGQSPAGAANPQEPGPNEVPPGVDPATVAAPTMV